MSATGQWKVTIKTPMGEQQADLNLKQDGAALSGTVTSAMLGSTDIEDAAANGDTLTWKLSVKSPMPMTLDFEAKISGDAIKGAAKAGAFGSFPIEGTRA